MKKLCLALIILTFFTDSFSQTAKVHLSMINSSATDCAFSWGMKAFTRDYLKKGYTVLSFDNDKKATYTVALTEPAFITFYCDSASNRRGKTLVFPFYLSPGDDLTLTADFAKKDFGLSVTGKGSVNNLPARRTLFMKDFEEFRTDTVPNRLINAIKINEAVVRKNYASYVEQYKPSDSFKLKMQKNVDYYAVATFYEMKENSKFGLGDAYYRNLPKWDNVTDSLFAAVKFDNAEALIVPNYRKLINNFLLRKKEALWRQQRTDPKEFYRDWYNTDPATGEALFNNDRANGLQEKIVNRYFTGPVAEYLYAVIFDEAFVEANPTSIVKMFGHFKSKFPRSQYIAWFSPLVDNLMKKEENTLNSNMVFASQNGTDLNTLEDVLKLAKGKTVLIDMWGTWCGPCRAEMDKNSAAIKEHFKNKGIDYFYIANNDLKNQESWKKLIAYFQLTGTHILANEKLSDDIMTKVKGAGYPTYIVIKKDGTYEKSRSGYPMKREILVKQLEEALASN